MALFPLPVARQTVLRDLTLDTIKSVSLYQKRKGYRFTIDSLLLADFVGRPRPSRVVDIGAGTGIVGLLLARRFPKTHVVLLELQEDLAELCRMNVSLNGLSERVSVVQGDASQIHDIHELPPASFDVAVCNPPFRLPGTGKISPRPEKALARHEIRLNISSLMMAFHHLLRPRGYAYMIGHPSRLAELSTLMSARKVEPKRARFVYPDECSDAKMILLEGVKAARPHMRIEKPVFIYNKGGGYSEEMTAMLGI